MVHQPPTWWERGNRLLRRRPLVARRAGVALRRAVGARGSALALLAVIPRLTLTSGGGCAGFGGVGGGIVRRWCVRRLGLVAGLAVVRGLCRPWRCRYLLALLRRPAQPVQHHHNDGHAGQRRQEKAECADRMLFQHRIWLLSHL